MIEGTCAPGFERVRAAFEANFARGAEIGAACAVWRGEQCLVDLWGGLRDARTHAPWRPDTLALVFSTTKGVAAIAVAVACARGLLAFDHRVARHWPEFAAHGKGDVTVRVLLEHAAGLCALDERLTLDVLADADRLASICARQRPAWTPSTRCGYHAFSLGFYQSELIRRVDPRGRRLGAFLREEIATPLDADVFIGLPDDVDPDRVATIRSFRPLALLLHPRAMPPQMVLAALVPGSLARRTLGNPRLRRPGDLARPQYRGVELASANGFATARGLARLYAALLSEPNPLVDADTRAALIARPSPPSGGRRDLVLGIDACYGLGFMRPTRAFGFGTDARAFGCPGAGGSFAFADPATGLGYAYTPNRMGVHLANDPRELALRRAALACARALD